MGNEVSNTTPAPRPEFRTSLVKAQDQYLFMIEQQFNDHMLVMDQYQKTCAINAIQAINEVLKSKGLVFNSPELDQGSLTGILQTVSALKLNAGAEPREVYFQIRNKKVGEKWIKEVEMGIEGNGNDALLRNFGVNVEKVSNPWLVREGDLFEYPTFNGFEMTPPKWTPKGQGKFTKIVYALKLKDGSTEFLIQERDDVKPNLMAHISNNLMNETFGFCADRYKATAAEKAKIDAKKKEIMDTASSMTMEEILDNDSLAQYISPAWREVQSREQMIIRKMRNNAVKKYPKDFGSMYASQQYASQDETYKDVTDTIAEQEVKLIDIPVQEEPKEIPAVTQAPGPAAPIQPPKTRPQPITGTSAPIIEQEEEGQVSLFNNEPGF